MNLKAVNTLASKDGSTREGPEGKLIAQPDRPTLPIRVPVVAEYGGTARLAEVPEIRFVSTTEAATV